MPCVYWLNSEVYCFNFKVYWLNLEVYSLILMNHWFAIHQYLRQNQEIGKGDGRARIMSTKGSKGLKYHPENPHPILIHGSCHSRESGNPLPRLWILSCARKTWAHLTNMGTGLR
jgi:hypothetical protein